MSIYDVTDAFEKRLCEFTDAPYAVAVDNQSNALFLALMWCKVKVNDYNTQTHLPKCALCYHPCRRKGSLSKFAQTAKRRIFT
jgi:Predicted pyridoxal phosphate-dependent enzyme apparently involved in regulation of cell wall biogenesis